MPYILKEENGFYGIDCSKAVWATDRIHADYHSSGLQDLSDVDWVIEDEDALYLIEYKNANVEGASKAESFNPMSKQKKLAQKYLDSLHYLTLLNKNKIKHYIFIVEGIKVDERMRKKLRNGLKEKLPFALQDKLSNNVSLIHTVQVLSIAEWNKHYLYRKFPLIKLK